MIIQFDRSIAKNNPQLFNYIESKSVWYPLYYVLDHRVRDSVNLQKWVKEQLDNTSDEVKQLAATFDSKQDADYIITDILRWVQKNIKYITDNKVYKVPEKWQSAAETLSLKTGDCEDGAILIFTLARLCGIPENRLLIMCGSVDGGGHAWLSYRPSEYPLNWCFMDWCYWFDRSTPSSRTKYYIKDTTIYNDPKNQYYSIWFAFNDSSSYKGIMNVA